MEPGWKQGTNLLSIHHEPGTLEITSLYTIPLPFHLYFGHFFIKDMCTKEDSDSQESCNMSRVFWEVED